MNLLLFLLLLFLLLLCLPFWNCRCSYSSGSLVFKSVDVGCCSLCWILWKNLFAVEIMAQIDIFWTCLAFLNALFPGVISSWFNLVGLFNNALDEC